MASGIAAVSDRPYTVDPGRIAPEVLRVFWASLAAQMPRGQAERVQLAAATVGLAGVWAALIADGRAADHLGLALEAAMDATARDPALWRRAGSDLVLSAIQPASPAPGRSQRGGELPRQA